MYADLNRDRLRLQFIYLFTLVGYKTKYRYFHIESQPEHTAIKFENTHLVM